MKKLIIFGTILMIAFCWCGTAIANDSDFTILENNVRLEFELTPLEDDDRPLFVITASSNYGTHTQFSGPDGSFIIKIRGKIKPMESGKIFILIGAEMDWEGDAEEAEFALQASVLAKPGEKMTVGRMGEKTLMVKASYVKDKE